MTAELDRGERRGWLKSPRGPEARCRGRSRCGIPVPESARVDGSSLMSHARGLATDQGAAMFERAAVLTPVVVASAVVLFSLPAAAKTTVTVSGDEITVHVPIDCAGCKGVTVTVPNGRGGTESIGLADKWQQDIHAAWGNAFENFKYCGRYRLKLDLTITPKAASFRGTKGHDLITVSAPNGGTFGAGFQANGPEHNPSGPPGQTSTDGTRYYQSDGDATISEDATPTVVTHETGHVLGLGDDRDGNGNPLPGRAGTLMVGGANGSNANSHLSIDQDLIDRIGRQAQKVNPKIQCERWTGMYHDEGGAGCSNRAPHLTHDWTFQATVGPDSVQAFVDPGIAASCGASVVQPAYVLPMRKTPTGFAYPGPINAGDIAITRMGNDASGSGSYTSGTTTFMVTIKMHCVSGCSRKRPVS